MTFSSVSSSRVKIGDDAPVAEDIDVVAIVELFGLGRVPEEGAAAASPPRGSGRRPRAWCRCRRRASGRPSARSSASEPSARANSAFCWLPPESDRMLLSMSGVRMPIFFFQNSASSASRCGEISRPLRSRASERMPIFSEIDHCGKMPSRLAVAGDQRHRRGRPRCRACARARGGEDREQQVGLAMAGKPGKADDLALVRDELLAVLLPRGPGAHPQRAGRRSAPRSRPRSSHGFRAAHRRDQPGRGRTPAPRRSPPPCRRASRRCGRRSAGSRRADARSGCSCRQPATKRRTKASNWPAVCASSEEVGSSRMTRSSGSSRHREGARHLDHLPLADRQVADDVARPRCRGRERFRRAWRRSARPPCAASRSRSATDD